MAETVIIELPSGRKVQFGGDGSGGGLGEAGLGEDIAEAGAEVFQAALGTLGDVVAGLQEAIGRLQQRPERVEVEFGASLTGKGNLWVVAGDGRAEFRVKLAWHNT